MIKELPMLKQRDWSVNLEDDTYADNLEELVKDAVDAIAITAPGCFVNLVTHAAAGHPEQGLIQRVESAVREAGLNQVELVYIDECGCGGFVTRAYRK